MPVNRKGVYMPPKLKADKVKLPTRRLGVPLADNDRFSVPSDYLAKRVELVAAFAADELPTSYPPPASWIEWAVNVGLGPNRQRHCTLSDADYAWLLAGLASAVSARNPAVMLALSDVLNPSPAESPAAARLSAAVEAAEAKFGPIAHELPLDRLIRNEAELTQLADDVEALLASWIESEA